MKVKISRYKHEDGRTSHSVAISKKLPEEQGGSYINCYIPLNFSKEAKNKYIDELRTAFIATGEKLNIAEFNVSECWFSCYERKSDGAVIPTFFINKIEGLINGEPKPSVNKKVVVDEEDLPF